MTSSTTLSAKSLSWKPGEGANDGDGASSVLTRMSVTLRCKKRIKAWAVKQELVEIWSSPTDGQWMTTAGVVFQFLCLSLQFTKSLMHVADSRSPSRLVTRSPCCEISPLESPSTLLKLVTLLIKPEVWLSSTASDLLYWCQPVERFGDDVILHHHLVGVWRRGDDAHVAEQWVMSSDLKTSVWKLIHARREMVSYTCVVVSSSSDHWTRRWSDRQISITLMICGGRSVLLIMTSKNAVLVVSWLIDSLFETKRRQFEAIKPSVGNF